MTRDATQSLLFSGVVLLLLGFLSGALIPVLTNPRLGLSAHLAGLQGGLLLMILALAWPRAGLSGRLGKPTRWLLLYSAYVIWASTLVGAIFGTSRATPIAGAGHAGQPWQEWLVTAGLTSGAVAVVVAITVLLYGFAKREN